MSLEILYQDEQCVAINKPAGMLVHRSWLDKHETVFVMQRLRDQLGRHVYPVHRLDRPTSGVLLFALTSEAARRLARQFENREVKKTYWAVVRGWMAEKVEEEQNLCADAQSLDADFDANFIDAGHIDYPLRVIRDKIADKHSQTDKEDQPAQTSWQLLATTEQPFAARSRYPTSRYSWVVLTPHTGRKHQLRRHMKHVFHPIIGDTSYGDHHQNRAIRQHVGVSRLMLHARSLAFVNLRGDAVVATAPVDDEWLRLCRHFGWDGLINDDR